MENTELYGVREVALEVGEPERIISYYFQRWQVIPTLKTGGRRLYSRAVVEIAKKMFNTMREFKQFKMPNNLN